MAPLQQTPLPAYQQAIEAFETLHELLIDQSKRIPVEQLFQEIKRYAHLLPDFSLVIKLRKPFRSGGEIDPESDFLLLRYLSFFVRNGQAHRFATPSDVYEHYKARKEEIFEEDNTCCLICDPNLPDETHELLDAISAAFKDYFHYNEFHTILDRSAVALGRIVRQEIKQPLDLSSILAHLAHKYDLPCAYVHRDGSQLVSIQNHTGIEIPSLPELLSYFDYALERRTITTGMYTNGGKNIFLAFIPFIQSQDSRLPMGCVLLASHDLIKEFSIRLTSHLAKALEEHRIGDLQGQIIEFIYNVRGEFLSLIRMGKARTFKERVCYLDEKLSELCNKLLHCTSAHSATIRLADQSRKSLGRLALADTKTSKYKKSFSGEISFSEWRNSVNAFTYRKRLPLNPVYLEDLSSKTPPDELRAEGFRGPKQVRKNSRSEICFPIWAAGLPIGTFNLESPRKRGFSDDTFFLSAVARHLGDLFAACDQSVDPLTLAQMTWAHEFTHGTLAQDLKIDLKVLPKEARQLVKEWTAYRRRFRANKYTLRGSKKSTKALCAELTKIINKGVPPLYKPNRTRLQVSRRDFRIDIVLYESLKLIVQSTVVNASRHSRLDLDTLNIRIGINNLPNACSLFELHYKSKIPIAAPELLDSFAISPLVKADHVRYGAFLMGHQVRALGGTISVRRSGDTAKPIPLEYWIHIPMQIG